MINKNNIIIISAIVFASILFLSFSFFSSKTPASLDKTVKNMFYSEIAKQKGGKKSDYDITSYYSMFKDKSNNKVDKNDMGFDKKVVKVEALINYNKSNDSAGSVYSAFVSYDISENKISIVSSQ